MLPVRRLAAMLPLCLLPVFALSAAAQAPISSYGVSAQGFGGNGSWYRFGIMGEVARPGAYELTEPFPQLSQLIRLAGGVTEAAAGRVRIVRRGRAHQRAFLSPALQLRLIPGDLVVVEPRVSASGRVRGLVESRSARDSATRTDPVAAPEAIQVAFVGLPLSPVVVKLRSQHASVPAVLSLLHQPAELLPSLRVLEGTSSRPISDPHALTNQPLGPLSVIVFPPGTAIAERLPAFPPAWRPASAASVSQPKPDRKSYPAEADTAADPLQLPPREAGRNTTHPHLLAPSGEPYGGDIRGARPLAETNSPGMLRMVPPASLPHLGSPSSGTTATREDGGARNRHSADEGPAATVDTESRPAAADSPETADSHSADVLGAQNDDRRPAVVDPNRATFYAVAIVVIVAMGVAAWLLWSMASDRRASAPSAIPKQESSSGVLEMLIRNRLPVVEEPVELPLRLELVADARQPRRVVVESGHALRGPHFESKSPSVAGGGEQRQADRSHGDSLAQPGPSETVTGEAAGSAGESAGAAESRPPSAAASAAPESPAAHRTSSLLARVLSTVQGGEPR